MNNWGVVIVLYNPDLGQLEKTVRQIHRQTDSIALVNNGSALTATVDNVVAYELGRNVGIASAQNYGVERLRETSPDLKYVFFLDQDSQVPSGYFEQMLATWHEVANKTPQLGALSPKITRRKESGNYSTLIFDQKGLRKQNLDFREQPLILNTLPISSGLMVSLEAFQAVGGLSENWFIDWVDFDFDLKLLTRGYQIATTGRASIIHEIGTPERRNFFGKKIAVTNYVLFREFYTARNGMYLIRKYGKKGNGIAKYSWGQIGRRFLMLIYEPKKIRRLATLIRGLLVGLVTSFD